MRKFSFILIAFTPLGLLAGCNANQDTTAATSSDIDARLSAEDRCESKGYKAPSKEYSDCFFSELSQSPPDSAGMIGRTTPATSSQVPPASDELSEDRPALYIPMQRQGGTYIVPVSINGRLTLDFVVDSGASDVSIPADVVLTLIRTNTLGSKDFLGHKTYVLADGSSIPSLTFRIRDLQVGGHEVRNVLGSVAPVTGTLLLGQSFLGRFKSWSIDNHQHVLMLN